MSWEKAISPSKPSVSLVRKNDRRHGPDQRGASARCSYSSVFRPIADGIPRALLGKSMGAVPLKTIASAS
jgi:hypothetical protein